MTPTGVFDGHRLVAVVRTDRVDTAEAIADAVVSAGLRVVEITSTVPDAPALVARLRERHGGRIMVGAGTVTTMGLVDEFVDAGAEFLVAPSLDADVLAIAGGRSVPFVPGALTPTEASAAHALGARTIKLFPAATVGIGHLRALRSVLPTAHFVPTGGVGPEDVVPWLDAGAAAVGIGSSLDRAFAQGGQRAIEELTTGVLDRIEEFDRTRETS